MKMCISNRKKQTLVINIIIKDTTIKEDIDEKDDKPQQCSKQQNHLAKQLPRKLSSPRQDADLQAPQAFQNVHFLQC